MIKKFKNMRDGFKTIKDLEKQLSSLNESGIDFSDSKKLLESLGVDIDELDEFITLGVETNDTYFANNILVHNIGPGDKQEI